MANRTTVIKNCKL